MKTPENIEKDILGFQGGSLQIFGDWFGRPHDNWHVPKSVRIEGNQLMVTFNEDEVLTVDDPCGITASKTEIRVQGASKVRWEWFYYGRPKTTDNRFFLEYEVKQGKVVGTTNEKWYQPKFDPSVTEPAVRIR